MERSSGLARGWEWEGRVLGVSQAKDRWCDRRKKYERGLKKERKVETREKRTRERREWCWEKGKRRRQGEGGSDLIIDNILP